MDLSSSLTLKNAPCAPSLMSFLRLGDDGSLYRLFLSGTFGPVRIPVGILLLRKEPRVPKPWVAISSVVKDAVSEPTKQ